MNEEFLSIADTLYSKIAESYYNSYIHNDKNHVLLNKINRKINSIIDNNIPQEWKSPERLHYDSTLVHLPDTRDYEVDKIINYLVSIDRELQLQSTIVNHFGTNKENDNDQHSHNHNHGNGYSNSYGNNYNSGDSYSNNSLDNDRLFLTDNKVYHNDHNYDNSNYNDRSRSNSEVNSNSVNHYNNAISTSNNEIKSSKKGITFANTGTNRNKSTSISKHKRGSIITNNSYGTNNNSSIAQNSLITNINNHNNEKINYNNAEKIVLNHIKLIDERNLEVATNALEAAFIQHDNIISRQIDIGVKSIETIIPLLSNKISNNKKDFLLFHDSTRLLEDAAIKNYKIIRSEQLLLLHKIFSDINNETKILKKLQEKIFRYYNKKIQLIISNYKNCDSYHIKKNEIFELMNSLESNLQQIIIDSIDKQNKNLRNTLYSTNSYCYNSGDIRQDNPDGNSYSESANGNSGDTGCGNSVGDSKEKFLLKLNDVKLKVTKWKINVSNEYENWLGNTLNVISNHYSGHKNEICMQLLSLHELEAKLFSYQNVLESLYRIADFDIRKEEEINKKHNIDSEKYNNDYSHSEEKKIPVEAKKHTNKYTAEFVNTSYQPQSKLKRKKSKRIEEIRDEVFKAERMKSSLRLGTRIRSCAELAGYTLEDIESLLWKLL